MPKCAATTNGVVELSPPASIEIVWVIGLRDEVPERLEGADHLVAARQLLDHHRRCAHHRRGHDERVVRNLVDRTELRPAACSANACCASSVPMYGSPPPPVPRIAAPTAMSSSSASPTSRNGHPPELEVADRLDPDPRRVAGEVRERHVLDVDDLDAGRLAPAATALSTASAFASSIAASRGIRSSEKTRSTSPPICAIAAPIAFATAKCSGLTSSLAPGSVVAEQDRAAADDDDRDRVGARLHPVDGLGDLGFDPRRAPAHERRSSAATRSGSPISASPAATARSVAVSTSPPKTSAR